MAVVKQPHSPNRGQNSSIAFDQTGYGAIRRVHWGAWDRTFRAPCSPGSALSVEIIVLAPSDESAEEHTACRRYRGAPCAYFSFWYPPRARTALVILLVLVGPVGSNLFFVLFASGAVGSQPHQKKPAVWQCADYASLWACCGCDAQSPSETVAVQAIWRS